MKETHLYRDASIIDHDIHAAVLSNTGADGKVHFASFGDIGLMVGCFESGLADKLMCSWKGQMVCLDSEITMKT